MKTKTRLSGYFFLALIFTVSITFFSWGNIQTAERKIFPETNLELKKAENLADFSLTEVQMEKVQKNGFFMTPSSRQDLYGTYEAIKEEGFPVFVTSDLVLHTAHLLFQNSIKLLELNTLVPKTEKLTSELFSATLKQWKDQGETRLKKAAQTNLAYFAVAKKLYWPKWQPPKSIRKKVKEEIKLINKNSEVGTRKSPLLGYPVDYSKFRPRGHYRRESELETYFKAMQWYQQITFRLTPKVNSGKNTRGREETLSAILMAKTVVSKNSLLDKWKTIEGVLENFFGEPDNLQVKDYALLMKEVFGSEKLSKEPTEVKLGDFISAARKQKTPTHLPIWAAIQRTPIEKAQGFCLFSGRVDLSSYVFQNLTYPSVGTTENPRKFPKGLDLMAVLGSEQAEKLLEKQGDFSFQGFEEKLSSLREEVSGKGKVRFGAGSEGLKSEWSNIFSTIVSPPQTEKGTTFTKKWRLKDLNTALGAWAEIKHDTVLYAKQGTTMSRGITTNPEVGFLEPKPLLYDRINSFSKNLLEAVKHSGSSKGGIEKKLTEFIKLTEEFKNISSKEITGEKLSDSQLKTIVQAISEMEDMARPPAKLSTLLSETDNLSLPLVTDVHRDPGSGKILEEAVGNPLKITLLVDIGGDRKLAEGATYSHYEFKRKEEGLLTDRKWGEMVGSKRSPDTHPWIESLLSPKKIKD